MNELKVIKACQDGNKESFNELIIFYYPFVLKFLLKLTANKEIAEDIVQETFIKLIKNIDKYNVKGKARFSTYLITIAKNCYLDYLKKNKKYSNDIDIDIVSDNLKIENKILDNDRYDIVLKEIDKLTEEQQIAMKLKYLEGLTLKEIATIQKTRPETVKSRLYEGKKKIKDEMQRGKFLWIEM